MSLRQLRKLQEKKLKEAKMKEEEVVNEKGEGSTSQSDEGEQQQQVKFKNAFSSIPRPESDSQEQETNQASKVEEDEKPQTAQQQSKLSKKQKKKLKKKNKKNKKNNNLQQDFQVIDQDYKLLQDLKKQFKAKSSEQQYKNDQQYKNSCLKMESQYFNANKQLSKLFSQTMDPQSASSSSLGGKRKYKSNTITQNAEEQKFFALDQYLYTQQHMNKKSTKNKKLLQHLSHRKHTNTILIQPPKYWIPPPPGLIKIKQISQTPQGHPIYTYQKATSYMALDQQFVPIQQSMNIQMLFQFTQRHPYHMQSLLYIADFFRMQGQFPSALQFLERALFVFEHGVWGNSTFSPIKQKRGLPSTSLDIQANSLNGIFCECLVKYLDVLKRKSCCRTGLEYTKLLLSLDVWQDPYGALLRIDYFAIRAKEFEFLVQFASQFPKEIAKDSQASLLILPNFLYSIALAKLYIDHKSMKQLTEDTLQLKSNQQLYQCLTQILSLTNLNSLLELPAQCLLICGMILYPLFLRDLIIKNGADKGQNYVNPKLFQDKQNENWSSLLKNGSIFQGSQGDFSDIEAVHDWICGSPQMETFPDDLTGKQPEQLQTIQQEVISKVRKILIEQSSGIYGRQWIMQRWFKQVCGFVLNALDQQIITQSGFIKHINSITKPCFFLFRYKHLKLSDFAEDISTINPQELQAAMMAGGGGGVGQQQPLFQEVGEQNQQQPEGQMNNLMNFLNQNPADLQHEGNIDEAELLQQYQLMAEFENNHIGENNNNDGGDDGAGRRPQAQSPFHKFMNQAMQNVVVKKMTRKEAANILNINIKEEQEEEKQGEEKKKDESQKTEQEKENQIDPKLVMENNSPAKGGSFYIQSKVYFAKEMFMKDFPQQLNQSKYNPDAKQQDQGEAKSEKKQQLEGAKEEDQKQKEQDGKEKEKDEKEKQKDEKKQSDQKDGDSKK